jgi:hypothetical protein
MIRDLDLDFLHIPDPESRVQKGIGSRIRIRNAAHKYTLLGNPALSMLHYILPVYEYTVQCISRDSPEVGDLLLVLDTELLRLLAVLHHVAADMDIRFKAGRQMVFCMEYYLTTTPKLNYFFTMVLNRLIDWRYSQSCWYFRPSFVNYCPSNLLSGSPPSPLHHFPKSSTVFTGSVWLGGD